MDSQNRIIKTAPAYLHNFTDHDNPTTNISITVDLPVDGFALWYDTVSDRIIQIDAISAGRQSYCPA